MKRKKGTENKRSSLARALAVGAGAGVGVWAVLLLAVSSVIAGLDEPEKMILPAVIFLAAAASLAGGAVAGRLAGSGTLAPGMMTGGVLLAAVWAVSLACASESAGSVSLPFKILLCAEFPLFALLGARLALPSAGKRRGGSSRRVRRSG